MMAGTGATIPAHEGFMDYQERMETLRQSREKFDQAQKQKRQRHLLRLVMGYMAILLLVPITVVCSVVILNSSSYPSSVVVACSTTLLIDVVGLAIGVWRFTLAREKADVDPA